MSKYVGVAADINWRYPFYSIKQIFHYGFKPVKWFFQRGWRGYADSDSWSADWYLVSIIPPMVRNLRDRALGYPVFNLPISEEDSSIYWAAILTAIEEGFSAGRKIVAYEFDEFGEDSLADLKADFDLGMELFSEYFFSLWD